MCFGVGRGQYGSWRILTKALGAKESTACFVDNGLLRQNEFNEVLAMYYSMGLNVKVWRQSETFLNSLKGVSDPEKRKDHRTYFL